jgi:hypothetical protein
MNLDNFNEKTDCGMCAVKRTDKNTDPGMNICRSCVDSCFG